MNIERGPAPEERNEEEIREEIIKMSKEQDEKLRQTIEKSFGKETLEVAENTSDGLDTTIKRHLLEKENTREAEKTLEIWRQFNDRIWQRLSAVNLHDPEMVETVLKMVTALVQPEADKKGESDVKAE